MFFNTHLKKGRELGVAVRQLMTTASIGTGYFDDAGGFNNPVPEEFFDDLYIRGFILVSCSLLMKFQLGGANWSHQKSGECLAEALQVIDPSGHLWKKHISLTADDANHPSFDSGRQAATTLFGVVHNKLRPDDPDPLLREAKAFVEASNGQLDLQFAVFKLSIGDYVEENFHRKLAEEYDEGSEDADQVPELEADDQEIETTTSSQDTKLCPYCAEEIKALAKKCKHCSEWLEVK